MYWFSVLSSNGEETIKLINPLLSDEEVADILNATVGILALGCRIAHISRSMLKVYDLLDLLNSFDTNSSTGTQDVVLKSEDVCKELLSGRYFMKEEKECADGKNVYTFDPRYLVFEFAHNILLRKTQVELVNKFVDSMKNDKSMCHQMIMGAGKTTVVGPLLSLILTNGYSLISEVVPHALLEFSRSTLRERFSGVIRKSIYTFKFTRSDRPTVRLYNKLKTAISSKSVLVTTPTAIKSFQLKFIETLQKLDELNVYEKEREVSNGFFSWFTSDGEAQNYADAKKHLKFQATLCKRILRLFKQGTLILDEVDLILHPLKSELNWPIGKKVPLDFSRSSAGNGLRWQLPYHLLDSLFYWSRGSMTVQFEESRTALNTLQLIRDCIDEGVQDRLVQTTPHLVLLNKAFYDQKLKPLLAQWMIVWLNAKETIPMNNEKLQEYILVGKKASEDVLKLVKTKLTVAAIKMVNLSHEWLTSILPLFLEKSIE